MENATQKIHLNGLMVLFDVVESWYWRKAHHKHWQDQVMCAANVVEYSIDHSLTLEKVVVVLAMNCSQATANLEMIDLEVSRPYSNPLD